MCRWFAGWLLAAGCSLLLIVGCWFVVGGWLRFVGFWLLVLVGGWWLMAGGWVLVIVGLVVGRRLLVVAECWLSHVFHCCWLLVVVGGWRLVVGGWFLAAGGCLLVSLLWLLRCKKWSGIGPKWDRTRGRRQG